MGPISGTSAMQPGRQPENQLRTKDHGSWVPGSGSPHFFLDPQHSCFSYGQNPSKAFKCYMLTMLRVLFCSAAAAAPPAESTAIRPNPNAPTQEGQIGAPDLARRPEEKCGEFLAPAPMPGPGTPCLSLPPLLPLLLAALTWCNDATIVPLHSVLRRNEPRLALP